MVLRKIWNPRPVPGVYPRLLLMKEMLADTGSIFVHIDWHVNSYVKVILDDILGKENFRNEIIWYYPNSGLKARSKKFHQVTDTIYYYVKNSNEFTFNHYSFQNKGLLCRLLLEL